LANSAAGIARRIDVPPNVRYLEKSGRDANIMECPLLTDTVEKGLALIGEQ
jgi:hypothetical protein